MLFIPRVGILFMAGIIFQKRRVQLTPEQASDFYAEHFGKLFFPSLVAYMSSGPVIALILSKEKAISYWRELVGPTNSLKARETHPDWYVLCIF
jgi:nucleoside-diphosphate kinase